MPRPRDTRPRVSEEPYYDKARDKWRVITRAGDGTEERFRFATKDEAEAYIAEYKATLRDESYTVEEAITAYGKDQEARALKQTTRATTRFRLMGLLAPLLSRSLRGVTPKQVKACFDAYALKPTTRRSASVELFGFAKFVKTEGLTGEELASEARFRGRIQKGKEQLKRTEAQRFAAKALELYAEGNEAGLVVLLALVLGLRTGEVINRVVSDIDDDCRLLWVTSAKSEAGIRQIEVPDLIRGLLQQQIEGKGPDDRLFKHAGKAFVRDWSKRICVLAGLTKEVTGQGLRGTFATLAVSHGVAPQVVAGAIGHADSGVTLGGSYAVKGSAQTGGAKKVLEVIQKGSHIQDQPRTEGPTVLH